LAFCARSRTRCARVRGASACSADLRSVSAHGASARNAQWERRAPLDPKTVGSLVQRGVQVLVQPSNRRVFTNEEYADAGAIITEDISAANTIFGVKEIPPKNVLPGKTYVLFAHVIKAQPSGMPLLDEFLKKNARLVDYEVIRNVQAKGGQRLVAFGKFAGLAGMIDGLRGLGERLLSYGERSGGAGRRRVQRARSLFYLVAHRSRRAGFSTPFLGLANSFMYPDLETAKKAVTAVRAERGDPALAAAPCSRARAGRRSATRLRAWDCPRTWRR
jgi:hypothetical protein